MEKKVKTYLTKETIGKKFKSSFDLVNYAISLADNMIKSGRDARVKSDIQNRAMLVLEEIYEGKDKFDDIRSLNQTSSSEEGHEEEIQELFKSEASPHQEAEIKSAGHFSEIEEGA